MSFYLSQRYLDPLSRSAKIWIATNFNITRECITLESKIMQSVENPTLLNWNLSPEFLHRYREGIIFKKSITVRFANNEAIFFGQRTYSVGNLTPAQMEAISLMVGGVTIDRLLTILSPADLADVIMYLDRNGSIRPVYENKFVGTRFEKQVEFFTDFVDDPNLPQQRLLDAAICILGCGGTGNILVQHFVSAGVKKFILIDGDCVERSNFNRQFCFDVNDLGQPKVNALKQYILDREPTAQVDTFHQRIDGSQDLAAVIAKSHQPNLIVCCADTPPVAIHTYVLEYCSANNTPCVFGAVGIHDGGFGPLLAESSHIENLLAHKRQQLQMLQQLTAVDEGTGVIPGSISYLNTAVAATIAGEAIDFISGLKPPVSLNSAWRYDPYTKSSFKAQDY
jgi:hypothetical protein